MFKFIIVLIILLVWFISLYRKKQSLIFPSVFTLGLYLLSVFFSYPHIVINDERLSLEPKYFKDAIVFLILLAFFLLPFINIKEDKINKLVLPNSGVLKAFSITIVCLSFFSIIYFTPIVIGIFSMSNLADARYMMTSGQETYVSESIWNTIASVSASFYTIALFLFFIYRSTSNNKKLSTLLLISSLSYVLNVFAYVGRDGVVFWIFSFIGTYGLFRRFLPSNDRKNIKRILITFLVLAIPLFMAITYDRFSDNPLAGIISYIGQSFPNFMLSNGAKYPDLEASSFPLFKEFFGLPIEKPYSGEFGGTVTWAFGTFLKTFILNLDIIGTIVLGIFMALIVKSTCRISHNKFYFHQLFIYFLYFQIYSQGVFYFRQYTRGGNLFIVLSFFFYLLFFVIKRHSDKPVVLIVKQ